MISSQSELVGSDSRQSDPAVRVTGCWTSVLCSAREEYYGRSSFVLSSLYGESRGGGGNVT